MAYKFITSSHDELIVLWTLNRQAKINVYPYEYMDDSEKFSETFLPEEKKQNKTKKNLKKRKEKRKKKKKRKKILQVT